MDDCHNIIALHLISEPTSSLQDQSDSRRMTMPHDTSETSRRSNNRAPRAESCKSQSSKTNQSLECVVLETPLIDDASRPR
jgi:hypothetical protein